MMPPLNQIIEISPSARQELSERSRRSCSSYGDNASVTSELSLSDFIKEQEDDSNDDSKSSNSVWNPDDSDYSLNVLLHKDESAQQQQQSLSDSAKESLLGSDYSLNVRLSSSQTSNPSRLAAVSLKTRETKKTSSEQTTSSTSERKTKVSFYPRVRIQRVSNRKDMTRALITTVWYSRDEFKAIRKECFQTIKLMTDGEELIDEDDDDDDENSFCSRGLEYKTAQAYKTRQRNKKEIRKVISEEQEFQIENGMDDPEWIAKLSHDQSRSCVAAAIVVAEKDEQEARQYHGLIIR